MTMTPLHSDFEPFWYLFLFPDLVTTFLSYFLPSFFLCFLTSLPPFFFSSDLSTSTKLHNKHSFLFFLLQIMFVRIQPTVHRLKNVQMVSVTYHWKNVPTIVIIMVIALIYPVTHENQSVLVNWMIINAYQHVRAVLDMLVNSVKWQQ